VVPIVESHHSRLDVGWFLFGCGSDFDAFLEPVAASVDRDDLSVVEQAIKDRNWRQARRSGSLPPLFDGRLEVIMVERFSYRRMMISRRISPLLQGDTCQPICHQ